MNGAVLFDVDGTLIESSGLWLEAHRRVAHGHGVRWSTTDMRAVTGGTMRDSASLLQGRGVPLSERAIIDALTESASAQLDRHCPWVPGALRLMSEVSAAGLRVGLVSSSYRRVISKVAAQAGIPFEVLVAGDDVSVGKPDPEPYAYAAALLGLSPIACVAVEDSPHGVASARAAGMHTVLVGSTLEAEPRSPTSARLVAVGSLSAVTVALLQSLVGGVDGDGGEQ